MITENKEEIKFRDECRNFVGNYVVCNIGLTLEFYMQHNPEFILEVIDEYKQNKKHKGKYDTIEFDDENEDDIEIFEYWSVNEWLYNQLKEHDEIVFELLDFYVWGRQCTGQAIYMDDVIREIVKRKSW